MVFSDSIASTFIQRGCFRAEYWFRKRTLIQRKSSIRIGHSNKENVFVVHIQFKKMFFFAFYKFKDIHFAFYLIPSHSFISLNQELWCLGQGARAACLMSSKENAFKSSLSRFEFRFHFLKICTLGVLLLRNIRGIFLSG